MNQDTFNLAPFSTLNRQYTYLFGHLKKEGILNQYDVRAQNSCKHNVGEEEMNQNFENWEGRVLNYSLKDSNHVRYSSYCNGNIQFPKYSDLHLSSAFGIDSSHDVIKQHSLISYVHCLISKRLLI